LRQISSQDELDQLSIDAGIIRLKPKSAYVAHTEDEVAGLLRMGEQEKLGITARGGGTSIPSQSVGIGAILLQGREEITYLDNGDVACQPALVKADLNRALADAGRWMPVDPSSYASCTIGGMVANNSSGIRRPKYGSTIDYVRELRVVVPGDAPRQVAALKVEAALAADERTKKLASLILENDSAIRAEAPKVTKNSSGYRLERVVHDGVFDLPKLFVGSEGTLGVFTEILFSTLARPKWKVLFIVESSLEELDEVVSAFRLHSPAALELVDKSVFRMMNRWERISRFSRSESPYMVFCELDGKHGDGGAWIESVAESKAGGYDPLVVSSAREIAEAWEARNETLTLAQEVRKGTRILVPGVEDLVVPPDRLGDLVGLLMEQFERRGLEYISYGHAGDANLHARPLLDISDPGGWRVLDELMEECFESVWKMGGSMTAEHGDGMLRARFVERQYPRTFWIMREVKRLYDPKCILNPGVKLPWEGSPWRGASPRGPVPEPNPGA
jgi:FAD/FMN-containing dehydrogenase